MTTTKEKSYKFTMNIPSQLHKSFHIWCIKNNTTMTDEVKKFMETKKSNQRSS